MHGNRMPRFGRLRASAAGVQERNVEQQCARESPWNSLRTRLTLWQKVCRH
jgi:hypothetical protein